MDETRKAASVGQLKELHDAVMPRLDALESEGKAEGDTSALTQALAARLVVLESSLDETKTMCAQMMEKLDAPDVPPDFTPIMTAIAAQGQQITALAKQVTQLMEMSMRPVNRTGEATLPDGGKIRLQVSETRM